MTTANLAVADNESVVQYESTGETVFAYPFPILSSDELKVSVDQALKTLGTDYTIDGVGDAGGGDVTFGAAIPAGQLVTLWLEMPIKRLTGFQLGAATLLPEALNTEFVRQVRIDQMLRRDIARSLRIPVDDPEAGQDLRLPTATERAGKFLRFADATGNPEVAAALEPGETLSQSSIGSYLWPRSAAEVAAGVIPTIFSSPDLPVIDARRYGFSPLASGSINTTALNNASAVAVQLGGGVVQLPPGAFNLDGRVNGFANVYIRGHGPNSTRLTQTHATHELYRAVDTSYCGLKDLRAVPGAGGDAIVWRALAGDPLYFQLRNVFVDGVADGKSGVWLDATGAHVAYFPHIENLVVRGGGFTNRTCLRIGNDSATYPVLGATIHGGRLFNGSKLLHLERAETLVGTHISLDDAQGGTGIGAHFQNTASCELYGLRVEPATFDTMIQFDALASDNLIISKHFGNVPSAKIVDNGTRNDIYGSDGSGGFINRLKLPLQFPDVRSLALTAAANYTAVTWHRRVVHNFDPASINGGATQETVVSIPGVLETDSIFITPHGGLDAGLVLGWAPTADAVRLILNNITGTPIDPVQRNFSIDIWRH